MRLYANPFNTQDDSFVTGVTYIHEANVGCSELEILQLRNNLNPLDKIFCKTAQQIQFHTVEKFCNER
jgi:hypothetical protein